MRACSRKLVVGIGSFFLAASLVAPSFAGKKVISDDELDNVTAAGEPTIIQTTGFSSSVTFSATTTAALTASGTSQNALRALILNNVIGENQVANGLNVSSGSLTGAQSNTISQSWGSIADITAATVAGISAAGGTNHCGFGTGVGCVVVIQKAGNASTSPGVVRVLSRTADVIVTTAGNTSPVTYNPVSTYALTVTDTAQSDLVALIVNNVSGLNQVANGVNISGAGVNIIPGQINLVGGANFATGQSNTISQFRGTPSNWTR